MSDFLTILGGWTAVSIAFGAFLAFAITRWKRRSKGRRED